MLDDVWASGSQAGNALILRGELLRHVLVMDGERDGRVIVDRFVERIEALIGERPTGVPAYASVTLQRYAMSQLCILRSALAAVHALP